MTYYSQQGAFVGSQWPQNNQPSAFQQFLYAFPRPRLGGRISKPRSAGNSPSAGRRRTATMHSTPTYRQPPAQDQQAHLNAALLAAMNRRRARPMSWHPALSQEYASPSQYCPPNMDLYNFPDTQPQPQHSQTMMGGFDDTMLHQFAGADMSNIAFQPSQELFSQHNPQADSAFWDQTGMGVPSFPPSNDWPLDMTSINQSVPSVGAPPSNYDSVSSPGPATPDFLPIQQFGDDAESVAMEKPEPEDELVGMGLYNNPDATDGLVYGMNGKGLKLEETFTPSAQNDEDDDEEEDQQEPEQDSNDQQLPPQPTKPAESMLNKSFFFENDDDIEQPTTARHSFNFPTNNFPTSCMNYGYGWI
ncbi:uncharacterized protein DSM5745_10176 [Aspergillus mulundensis]|uniref:Uncharacterized protein n=1 Tax=Aspergillus mulundensis TaxID=1810919 RepID=A0A3D8QMP7_9EURO|nr:Uncharacterized protein DSM5745_10176 [Aspergillus mulundensis]RDW63065.1 Uncharacterized protein DSM5745_10176 [Aspergillus mulundensis]